MSTEPPAKFFVNRGIVSSRTDIHHLLRPLLKQTVSYRYYRGRELVDHGTGWVERIVVDHPDVSTFFTPLSICLNIDSFEHLEFETRMDQLIAYALVQGDERVVIEFAPVAAAGEDRFAPRQLEFDTSGFVQMELLGFEVDNAEGGRGPLGQGSPGQGFQGQGSGGQGSPGQGSPGQGFQGQGSGGQASGGQA